MHSKLVLDYMKRNNLEDAVIERKTVLYTRGILRGSVGQCGQELCSLGQCGQELCSLGQCGQELYS